MPRMQLVTTKFCLSFGFLLIFGEVWELASSMLAIGLSWYESSILSGMSYRTRGLRQASGTSRYSSRPCNHCDRHGFEWYMLHCIRFLGANDIILCAGTIGARLHVPFPVLNRSSFGFWFSYFSIISRVVLAMFWFGIQVWFCVI
jgi:hypothetical protein